MNATPNTWKATLALSDIEPSKDNPRQDFGDIGALADRIRATDGQPINPIVCVKDGEKYRIVDGERRYRALLEIYGEFGTTAALVFSDYSEAHAAVAMLATDDKQPLSAEEQARGFQTMMRLDVPTDVVTRATGIDASDVAAARRAMPAAGRAAEGTRVTLEDLIVAGGPEFTEEERDEILASDWPSDTARALLDAKNKAEKLEKLWDAMPGGIERRDLKRYKAAGCGLLYVCEVKSAKAARELELEEGKTYVALAPDFPHNPATWAVYTDEGGKQPRADEVRRAREQEERDLHDRIMRELRAHWMHFVAENWTEDLPALEALVIEGRNMPASFGETYDMEGEEWQEEMRRGPVTGWDLLSWLDGKVHGATPWPHWGSATKWDMDRIVTVWNAMEACGWEPEDDDEKVIEECRRLLPKGAQQ